MKKSFVLLLILAFVAGYGLNALVKSIGIDQNQTGGDISKAKRYNRIRSDVQLDLLQEKLQNDDKYYNQTKEVASFLLSRVNNLADLTERTIEQCSGIEEFKDQVASLKSLNVKAGNTSLALESVSDGLDRMAQGKDATNFEQSYNNSVAGFFRIKNQNELGKSFVESAGKYLENNENDAISSLASEWAVYCFQDAAINKSESDMAYWNAQYNGMSNEEFVDGLNPDLMSGMNLLLDNYNDIFDMLSSASFLNMLQVLHFDFQADTNRDGRGKPNINIPWPPIR